MDSSNSLLHLDSETVFRAPTEQRETAANQRGSAGTIAAFAAIQQPAFVDDDASMEPESEQPDAADSKSALAAAKAAADRAKLERCLLAVAAACPGQWQPLALVCRGVAFDKRSTSKKSLQSDAEHVLDASAACSASSSAAGAALLRRGKTC